MYEPPRYSTSPIPTPTSLSVSRNKNASSPRAAWPFKVPMERSIPTAEISLASHASGAAQPNPVAISCLDPAGFAVRSSPRRLFAEQENIPRRRRRVPKLCGRGHSVRLVTCPSLASGDAAARRLAACRAGLSSMIANDWGTYYQQIEKELGAGLQPAACNMPHAAVYSPPCCTA